MQTTRFLPLLLVLALAGCDTTLVGVGPLATGIPNVLGPTPLPAPTVPTAPAAKLPPAPAGTLEATIRPIAERHAATYDVPVGLVLAVINRESAFKANAVSASGAQGLMQLMPATQGHIRSAGGPMVIDPFDPEQNVAGGCWYLRWVRSQVPAAKVADADAWRLAIAGYNAGIGRVTKEITKVTSGAPASPRATWDAVGPALPAETRAYVPAVMTKWQSYGAAGGWGTTR